MSYRSSTYSPSLVHILILMLGLSAFPAPARADSTWTATSGASNPYLWGSVANWSGGVPISTATNANFGATTNPVVIDLAGSATAGNISIQNGSYTFQNGTLTFLSLAVTSNLDTTLNATLSSSGSITKAGTGQLTISAANTDWTGGLTVNGGTVDILANTGLSQQVVVNAGGSLKIHTLGGLGTAGGGLALNNNSQMSFLVSSGTGGAFTTGAVSMAGNVTLNIGRDSPGSTVAATIPSLSFASGTNVLTINNVNVTSGGILLQLTGTTNISGNTTMKFVNPGTTSSQVFFSTIAGSGSLTLDNTTGNNIVAISADSPSFTGSVNMNAPGGKLLIQGNTGITGVNSVSAGTLRVKKSSSLGGTSFASPATLNMTGGALDLFVDGSVNFFVNLNVLGDATLMGTRSTPGNVLDHTVGAMQIGSSTLTTTGVTTGASPTTIGYTYTTQAVTLTGAAVFNVGQASGTQGLLKLGAIGEATPGRSLTKTGNGTLVLSGTNTYTGPTLVSAGTLNGSGSLASAITVASGATLAPGTSVIERQWNTGSITFNAGSTLRTSLFGTDIVDISMLNVTGNVTVSPDALLTLDLAGIDADELRLAAGDFRVYTIIQGTGTVGNFAPNQLSLLNQGNFLTTEWFLSASPTPGTVQVIFAPIPEPGTVLGLSALGFGIVGLLRRRKPAATNER